VDASILYKVRYIETPQAVTDSLGRFTYVRKMLYSAFIPK